MLSAADIQVFCTLKPGYRTFVFFLFWVQLVWKNGGSFVARWLTAGHGRADAAWKPKNEPKRSQFFDQRLLQNSAGQKASRNRGLEKWFGSGAELR
jgi:hypothetical protein